MQTTAATCRAQAPFRAMAAPRRPAPLLHAASRPSVRVRSIVSDVGRYLSEAASQIFSPQSDDVPWETSSTPFTGAIRHHDETARLQALKQAVEVAIKEIEPLMESAPADEPATAAAATEGGAAGDYVMTSIQKVFSNNFSGAESEPKAWLSSGYSSATRPRSQRALRHEYQRLQRFRTVVDRMVTEVQAAEPSKRDM